MKKKIFMTLITAALILCVFPLSASAAADYAQNGVDAINTGNNGDVIDMVNQVPLAEAAPATGIDQSELAMQRAFDVAIFGLGISLASVVTVAAVKKHANKEK